jgi:hypothetical protein
MRVLKTDETRGTYIKQYLCTRNVADCTKFNQNLPKDSTRKQTVRSKRGPLTATGDVFWDARVYCRNITLHYEAKLPAEFKPVNKNKTNQKKNDNT